MTDHESSADPKANAANDAVGADESSNNEEAPQALAPLDFSTFLMSLGSSAMVNLGQIPPPGGTRPQRDLAAAKQIIDILGILEEKTRGNLDESETKLLKSLLYDLRVHYVDAQTEK